LEELKQKLFVSRFLPNAWTITAFAFGSVGNNIMRVKQAESM